MCFKTWDFYKWGWQILSAHTMLIFKKVDILDANCVFPVVQHECIPQAVLGMDVLCQAKSGMGKTAVFVLATLQQIETVDNQVSVLVLCHTRELAFQISKEYERFSKYMPTIKVSIFLFNVLLDIFVSALAMAQLL